MWTGWPTFPMVFAKGVLIGGASDLERLLASGELKRFLGETVTARRRLVAAAALLLGLGRSGKPRRPRPARVAGLPHELLCGSLSRPLDPSRPGSPAFRAALPRARAGPRKCPTRHSCSPADPARRDRARRLR